VHITKYKMANRKSQLHLSPGLTMCACVCVCGGVTLVAQRQPCVQAFTRMVKVWKQGCVGQSWCMGYERR